MTAHPNRGQRGPGANPRPDEVRAARHAAGFTQAQAARLIHGTLRAWEGYEAPEGAPGARRMHPGLWELFRLKTAPPVVEMDE